MSPYAQGKADGLCEAAAKARESADRLAGCEDLMKNGQRYARGAIAALREFANVIDPPPCTDAQPQGAETP